jgi:tRNA/tmRNA/rRNA uracil-C5-methylase (TrmA/RlmC/RlmD family)
MLKLFTPSENALDEIKKDSCVIVDPPRAGLHRN